MTNTPTTILGAPAWTHDEGHAAGTFITWDALDPDGLLNPGAIF